MGSAGLPYGLQAMLKDGHKHLAGLDEAVYRNIEACKQFAQIIRTSMGPRGNVVSIPTLSAASPMPLHSRLRGIVEAANLFLGHASLLCV